MSPPGGDATDLRLRWLAALALAVVTAFAFTGSRGLWEPDEGRYADAALTMVRGGSLLVPELHSHPYLDKPPLHYWGVAAGIATLGRNEWGARAANALCLLLTSALAGTIASRLWGARAGPIAVALYATTLLPVLGAAAITPDTPLALATAAWAASYIRARDAAAAGGRWGWGAAAALSLALGILTKGPAMLVFAAPMALDAAIAFGPIGLVRRRWDLGLAALAGLALGGSWYVWVAARLPGAFDYLFANQVSGRLWEETYDRNSGLFEVLVQYGPALTIGMLPGALLWPAWASRALAKRSRPNAGQLLRDPRRRLLALWVAVPLAVLVAASSRLPLYVLPLSVPLVVAVSGFAATASRGTRRTLALAIAVSALFLVVLKGVAARIEPSRDSRALARALGAAGVGPETLVVTVDEKRHALPFYGYERLLWTERAERYPYFSPPARFEEELPSLRRDPVGPILFLSRKELDATLAQAGFACHPLRPPKGRLHLRLCKPPEAAPRADER